MRSDAAQGTHVLKNTWELIEPAPIRRRRLMKGHIKQVYDMTADSKKYFNLKQELQKEHAVVAKKTQAQLQARRKRIEHKEPSLKKLRQMKEAADKHEREEESLLISVSIAPKVS